MTINGFPICMEYDTGASCSVINKKLWEKLGKQKLKKTKRIVAYPNIPVRNKGKCYVKVNCNGIIKGVYVIVTEEGSPIFGKSWMKQFKIEPNAKHVKQKIFKLKELEIQNKEDMFRKEIYGEVFQEKDFQSIKYYKAEIHLKDSADWKKVHKSHSVPFTLKTAIEQELERLENKGIIKKVKPPIDVATPIVVVSKGDGSVRICGDFKVTINTHLKDDFHPVPSFEDIRQKIDDSTWFSVIDLKDAYLQLELDENSRKYLTITTHKGYHQYCRMPFGIKTAPSIFQRVIDQVLAGIEKTASYFDDVCI